jgi:hypothetical protein
MANTTVGASVQVEFASVGQMRKAIKEATSDLIAMQEQFGKTSPQAIAAAKRIAELKDRIQDAKEQADLFDPGKRFSAFANAASQVAAGFSAVQGAMALVGSESEDLQKTLVKVQGAMALSQGLSQLADFGKAFDEIKVVAVNAFKSIRAAIGSTGIGLLVIALGTIVAYWDDIKEAVSGVSEEQKKLNEESKKNLKTQQDKLDAINSQDNTLKLQGKTEKEILNDKIKQYDIVIKTAKAQLVSDAEIQKGREKAAERNAEITKNIINGSLQISTAGLRLLAAPIDALILTANKVSKALGFGEITSTTLNEELSAIITKVSEFSTSFLFDPEKVRKQGEKANEEAIKNIKKLENDRDGLILQGRENDLANAKKSADDQQKINDDRLKKQQEADKVLQEARLAKLTDQQREEEESYKRFTERRLALEAAGIFDFTAIAEQGELELKVIRDKYKKIKEEEDKKAQDEKLAKEKAENERVKAAHENTRKMVAEQNAALLQAEINLQNQRFNAAQAGLQLLEGLAGENERIANLIFAVQKGLEIARIVTDTARGIVAAKAGLAAVPPFIGVAPNPAFILAAASAAKQIAGLKIAAAVSIAQIAAASIQRFKRGGGAGAAGGGVDVAGGGGAPVAAQPSPTVTATAVNTQAVNALGNQSMRAYVLNSDITNNDQRNAYLERNARLG